MDTAAQASPCECCLADLSYHRAGVCRTELGTRVPNSMCIILASTFTDVRATVGLFRDWFVHWATEPERGSLDRFHNGKTGRRCVDVYTFYLLSFTLLSTSSDHHIRSCKKGHRPSRRSRVVHHHRRRSTPRQEPPVEDNGGIQSVHLHAAVRADGHGYSELLQ